MHAVVSISMMCARLPTGYENGVLVMFADTWLHPDAQRCSTESLGLRGFSVVALLVRIPICASDSAWRPVIEAVLTLAFGSSRLPAPGAFLLEAIRSMEASR